MSGQAGRRNPHPQTLARACWAAVGLPCICRWASWEEVGTSPTALFIVLVGGCSPLFEVPAPVVCAICPGVGPEPASLLVVLHGPASATPAEKMIAVQVTKRIFAPSWRAPSFGMPK